jgi:hypothetical protein
VQLDEFFWQVESDERLRGVDLRKGDSPEADLVVVEDLKTGFKTSFAVPVILECSWADLRGMAAGHKEIDPLYHVSRIVGYYSRIENWNKSKRGELADRRAGDYSMP